MLQSVERLPLLPIQSRKNSLAHIEPTARLSGNFLVVPEGKVSEDIRSSKDSSSGAAAFRPRLKRRRGSKLKEINAYRKHSGKFEQEIKPGERLRRIIKCILMIVEVCMQLKRYVQAKKKEEKEEKLSLVEMQLKLQADINKTLPFNPHLYKASNVINKGSSKLKKLLAINPEARTRSHIKSIHALVRNKAAFSKHPIHIRMRLCQVMIYQAYEPRRVIIKQGHPPTAFYIILSGTCLINVRTVDEGGEKVITINEIKEGEVFGEVALLNNTARTASVVCKDNCELLVIYQQDFDKTVRGPIYKQREEIIDFCRNMHILKSWPVDMLLNASYANFQYQYFRKGTIVVKKGLECNFVVFIKSGECKLISVMDHGETDDLQNTLLENLHKMHDINSKRTTNFNNNRSRKSFRLSTITEGQSPFPQLGRIKYSRIKPSNLNIPRSTIARPQFLPRATFTRPDGAIRKSTFQVGSKIKYGRSNLQAISEIKAMRNTKRISIDQMPTTDFSPSARYLRNTAPRESVIQDTPYAIKKKENDPYLKKFNKEKETDKAKVTKKLKMPVLIENKTVETKESKKPKFVQIADLKSGSVFGLEELMKRTKLNLTLLSEGSEVVFLSRKLLLRHADGETMRRINSVIGRYPTEEFIRAQLDFYGDWNKFRKSVVNDILQRKEEKTKNNNCASKVLSSF